MKTAHIVLPGLLFGCAALASTSVNAAGNPEAGARVFRACQACHTLEPDQHMSGPSLAGIWGRKAGTIVSFPRYSKALKAAVIVWNEKSFDSWIANPQSLVPGNRMTFRGIRKPQVRADLIAYLRVATKLRATPRVGKTRKPLLAALKTLGPRQQVKAIRLCGDSYFVTTVAGNEMAFWEFNLRFKTNTGKQGPHPGKPVILPAGMQGDRASIVFADPNEISALIEKKC